MKIIKRFSFILCILFLWSGFLSSAGAQDRGSDNETVKQQQPTRIMPSPFSLLKGIQLTDDQKEKIASFRKRLYNALKNLKEQAENGDISREELINKTNNLNRAVYNAVQDLLTDEQKKIMAANLRNELNTSNTSQNNALDLVKVLPRMLNTLDLSEEQKTQIYDLIGEARKSIGDLLQDMKTSSPEEKQEMQNEMNKLVRGLWTDIHAPLDEEQKAKLDGLLKRWQNSRKNKPDFQQEIKRFHEALKLTDEQKEQWKEIYVSYHEQLKALGEQLNNAGTKEEKMEIASRIRDLTGNREQEIIEILTPDQQALYHKFQNYIRTRAQEIRKAKAQEAWVMRLADQLDLTPQQTRRIRAIEEKYSEQLNKLRQRIKNANETDQEKIRQHIHRILMAKDKAVRSILTEEQQVKFDELKAMIAERRSEEDEPSSALAKAGVPDSYDLKQNYPNPFNPTTEIEYQLPEVSHVQLLIFNLLGQKVRTLINAQQNSGFYTVTWDGKDDSGNILASGVYFYQLVTPNYTNTHKMMFLK